jgi:hypothetical protein
MRINLRDVVARGRKDDPTRRGVAFGVLGLSDVDANTPFAGLTFNKMRRPGTQCMFNTLGLKTSLGLSTRPGSRSSPRVSARLAIIPLVDPRTEPF